MKYILLVLILTAALTACKKDEIPAEQLPAATTTGANTAGCYVDDKLWIAKRGNDYFGSNKAINGGGWSIYETDSTDRSYIWMWFTDRINGGVITISLDSIPKVGQTFICNRRTCSQPACVTFINYASFSDASGFYMTDSSATGSVTFTKADTVTVMRDGYPDFTNILSGTFEFTAKKKDNGKLIHITSGRFDFIQ